ncbi:hypothetical protein LTR66_001781 [Elasticomyces elasticus]|nr:hypothetical protein LTR50_001837 [Elasticomyces elasticus]KAK4999105.1 hypothetical protein LTR66_001781 [Elasticomyces elasticus]
MLLRKLDRLHAAAARKAWAAYGDSFETRDRTSAMLAMGQQYGLAVRDYLEVSFQTLEEIKAANVARQVTYLAIGAKLPVELIEGVYEHVFGLHNFSTINRT